MINLEIIYKISSQDLKDLEKSLSKDLKTFYIETQYLEECKNRNQLFIFKNNNQSMGFVTCREDNFCVQIDNFLIKSEFRLKGIGKHYFQLLEKHFIRQEIVAIQLYCSPQESSFFWQKVGFKKFNKNIEINNSKFSFYKYLIKRNENTIIDEYNKIELWDYHSEHQSSMIEKEKPKWVWSINNNIPILNQSFRDWHLRITINGKIFKEDYVKYIKIKKEDVYHYCFLHITKEQLTELKQKIE